MTEGNGQKRKVAANVLERDDFMHVAREERILFVKDIGAAPTVVISFGKDRDKRATLVILQFNGHTIVDDTGEFSEDEEYGMVCVAPGQLPRLAELLGAAVDVLAEHENAHKG